MSRRHDHGDGRETPLSRGDIETLCVLHAVGDGGCPALDLAGRLGLSRTIAAEVAAGMQPLVDAGLLALEEDRLLLTDGGRRRLRDRSGEGTPEPWPLR